MYIFDRFEGGIAFIENDDDEMIEVPKDRIAENVRSGDVLIEKDGMYLPDKEETEKRRKKITELQNSLWG